MVASSAENFQVVFDQLRHILKQFETHLIVHSDTADNYYLNTPYHKKYKKELFFGAVQIKKRYVSYHLMPVYMFPDLLDGLSESLQKRMQGKSCFNFRRIEPEQLKELADLTERGWVRLKQEGELAE